MSAAGKLFESPPKTGFYPAEQKAAIEAEGTMSAGSRSEKSLGILTTKFVTLLQEVSGEHEPSPWLVVGQARPSLLWVGAMPFCCGGTLEGWGEV